jgi:hypothetical protein
MGLVSSGSAKGEKPLMSPAVPNETEEQPVVLEKVEISPGNFIKMSPTDKAAWERHNADAAATQAAWERTTAGVVAAAAAPDAASVLAEVLSKDELVYIADGRDLATSGSKAKIASRIAVGAAAVAEDDGDDTAGAGPDGSATADDSGDEAQPV